MFCDCKSLFLSLKLHALVLKVKNINVVLVGNLKTKIRKLAAYNYANDNKLFGCRWIPITVQNICLFENLPKKANEKVSEGRKIISNSCYTFHQQVSRNI